MEQTLSYRTYFHVPNTQDAINSLCLYVAELLLGLSLQLLEVKGQLLTQSSKPQQSFSACFLLTHQILRRRSRERHFELKPLDNTLMPFTPIELNNSIERTDDITHSAWNSFSCHNYFD